MATMANSRLSAVLGALPIEAELQKRQLSLLHRVISSENQCLQDLVERQIACSFNNVRSFFYLVSKVLLKYDLPTLNKVVTSNFTKIQWKKMYTKAIKIR